MIADGCPEEIPLLATMMDGKIALDGPSTVGKACTSAVKAPKAPPRHELQGLRALAISAVLLFHCWSSRFTTGYLGVDVFFIISGYLMCHLLSRRIPLGFADVADFYFRRIKRIVPIYLFVVGLTLAVAQNYVSRLDYQQLIDETIPSMFFFSNSPSVHKVEYFDLKSKYFFFLHTWSLSTEMQFYLVVPFLFLIAQKLSRPSLIFTFGALLFILSFMRQCFAEGVAKHMPLDGRIWQFMSGFAAHFFFEWGTLKVSDKRMLKLAEDYPWMGKCGKKLLDYSLNILLTVLLLVSFSEDQQLERFVVIFVGTVFVALPNNSESFLSADFLVKLGDVSYSIYLIHWPVFTLHRFIDESIYDDGKDPPHIVGTYLITVSMIAGYIVEKVAARLLRQVKSWASLIPAILILYSIIAAVLLQIGDRAITLDPSTYENSNESLERVTNHTLDLWATRKSPKPLTQKEALEANMEITYYGYFNGGCTNRNATLPSKFKYEWHDNGKYCHEKGTGNKTVVVVGNSHAYHSYLGVRQHFLDIASTISLFSLPACTPVPEVDQQYNRGPVSSSLAAEYLQERMRQCAVFINETIELIRQWEKPVDIVITLFGYHVMHNPPPTDDYERDSMFRFMQNYYNQLNQLAKEAVFVSLMNLHFAKKQVKVLEERLLADMPIGEMGETKAKQLHYLNEIRHRLERIECSKCIKMNWHKLWCTAKTSTFCSSAEAERGISYFLDNDHVTPYGSMFVGEAMKHRYKNFLKHPMRHN